MIVVGKYSNGLNKLTRDSFLTRELESSTRTKMPEFTNNQYYSNICTEKDIPNIWHLRLRQVSDEVLNHIPNICMKNKITSFPICPGAKQHRMSFKNSETFTSYRLQMLHCDLWGLYATPSKISAHLFLTIVNDYSRMTWTILLQNKTQVFRALKVLLKMIQTQLEAKVKVIRSDDGLEFKNQDLECYFNIMGSYIKDHPYTP